jgi:hypothetical protein
MAALNQAHANNIIDASMATAAFTASTAPMRCRLMTANGTATAAGTELATSGGYTSGTGAPSVTFSAASAGSAASSSAVTVTNMPAATIVGIELWDSAGTPVRKWFGALSSSKTTNAGDTFTIAIGSLTAALS